MNHVKKKIKIFFLFSTFIFEWADLIRAMNRSILVQNEHLIEKKIIVMAQVY